MVTVPIKWIEWILTLIAGTGILLGVFSFVLPKRSIELYQWIMRHFNWRVEPIDYARELKTTRIFGIVIVVLCGLMLAALFRPGWFLLGG